MSTQPLLLDNLTDKSSFQSDDNDRDHDADAEAWAEGDEYEHPRLKNRDLRWWNKPSKCYGYSLVILFSTAIVLLLTAISGTFRHTTTAVAKTVWEPSTFWGPYVDEDTGVQSFMESFYRRRRRLHEGTRARAERQGKKRNDRTPGGPNPIVVYWPNPPFFWAQFFGKGQGEHIPMDNCPVACELVSGFSNDPRQDKAHMLLQYNIFEPLTLKGLQDTGSVNELLPFQKAVMFSLEPNTFQVTQEFNLELFDMVASLSRHSEIHFETYSPRLYYKNRIIGLVEVTSTEMADEIWGPNRDLKPTRSLLEGTTLPPELAAGTSSRIATFISNCHAPSRNRYIRALVKEGVQFDHYGKCNETHFGGTPPPYSLSYVKEGHINAYFEKMAVLSLYKFNLVMENTICTDYISEKVSEGIFAGSLPIILGAPNLVDELQPPGSPLVFINGLQYEPSELAALIRKLDKDPIALQTYKTWLKDLPNDGPVTRYFQRARKNDAQQNQMRHPICEMCKFYAEYYDWEGDAPLKF